jgi:rare lipoprotein A
MFFGIGVTTLLAGGTVVAVASLNDNPAEQKETATSTVNVDSLYTAMVESEPVSDTSSSVELVAKRTLNGHTSWYGPGFHGRKTANGERFDRNEMTAAHKTLPFGTLVRVTDEKTGKSILVRINDRGPYIRGRLLDLSEGAAARLGIKGRGTGNVRLDVFTPTDLGQFMTFDAEGRAKATRGYSVRILRTKDFNDAINLQLRLADKGADNVLLSRVLVDGKPEYQVSVGLFSTERLCQSLLAELVHDHKEAMLIRFEDGRPIEPMIAGS